jgi:hypothetical protein
MNLLDQFRYYRLRLRGDALVTSYFRVSEELGINPNAPQPPFQVEKLHEAKAIASQLRALRFPASA